MMNWIIESAEGELVAMDCTKDEALSLARELTVIIDEPVSVQDVVNGEEVVILPDGSVEHQQ